MTRNLEQPGFGLSSSRVPCLPLDSVLPQDLDSALAQLRQASPALSHLIERSHDAEAARDRVWAYLCAQEKVLLGRDDRRHLLEKSAQHDAIHVMRSIFAPVNEQRVGTSALELLHGLLRGSERDGTVSVGFVVEFLHLFGAVEGQTRLYGEGDRGIDNAFLAHEGRSAALMRSKALDAAAARLREGAARYPCGLEPEVVERRRLRKQRILRYFDGSDEDWLDHRWHTSNVLKRPEDLLALVDLPEELADALRKGVQHRVPIGLTPYYLSLIDEDPALGFDHAVRAQVLPPPEYVDVLAAHMESRSRTLDFMGERDTSPVDLVTRRYPNICILKPYNTCAQICVYCQRNWEIDECMAPGAMASQRALDEAIDWIAETPAIGDVLVTGGDPIVMSDARIRSLLGRLSEIPHVYRIRIGTRTPVVLPFRWTDELADILGRHHMPGRREIAVMTHFEHPYEITPEARDAIRRIRLRGMGVYNQNVFTFEVSRRFEAAKLRQDLRRVGVDPYYTFNMKGKAETASYMVPIARLLQERKEEARLLPGLDRTDEPVFNLPRLGKNHLRAFQDHHLISIRADGRRVYEFHPWEKNISLMPGYVYTDTAIYDYLRRMEQRGEDPIEYETIWYYY